MNDVAQLLSALGQGNPHVASRLLPLVYDELRKLAAQRMAQEQPGQTLQPTALVHQGHLRGGPAGRRPFHSLCSGALDANAAWSYLHL